MSEAVKGKALTVSVWSLIAVLLSFLVEHWATITGAVLSFVPDAYDPIVSQLLAFVLSVLMLFVGPSRVAPKPEDKNY